ncbi:helix-hairpin-helix domain-containing protein [Endozoicomonas sp. G2_2]|uniref:helix-hairpin-helix domain-containing protein n=1 Tax=Endozoicomonas sp. G2_2 TaxID=2821092 RepID=UPI0032AFE3AB
MKKLLSLLGSRRSESGHPQSTVRAERQHDEFADVIEGYAFAATLQLRTPFHVLQHHGEVFRGRPSEAPTYGTAADGIWLPWTGYGNGLPDSSSSSDIGSIMPDGYLSFLKAYRQIVESLLSANDKLAQIRALSTHSDAFDDYYQRLTKSYAGFPESRFGLTVDSLPNIGKARLMGLRGAGLTSLEALAQSSVDELKTIEGIGHATAVKLQTEARARLQGATIPVAGERLPG